MPGCVLHVSGTKFGPRAFLRKAHFEPYQIWRVGKPLARVGRRSNQYHKTSGFSCEVSRVDGELELQIKDAMAFISNHRKDFEMVLTCQEVEECRLDFGYDCRLSDRIWMQGEYLPVEFLQLVGELRIAVALSLYPALKKTKKKHRNTKSELRRIINEADDHG